MGKRYDKFIQSRSDAYKKQHYGRYPQEYIEFQAKAINFLIIFSMVLILLACPFIVSSMGLLLGLILTGCCLGFFIFLRMLFRDDDSDMAKYIHKDSNYPYI